jgi:hypothetical protein
VIAQQLHCGAAVLRVGGLRAHGVEERRSGGGPDGLEDRAGRHSSFGAAAGQLDEPGGAVDRAEAGEVRGDPFGHVWP